MFSYYIPLIFYTCVQFYVAQANDLDTFWHIVTVLFSSPEHKVLRVSFCDLSLSGIRLSIHTY